MLCHGSIWRWHWERHLTEVEAGSDLQYLSPYSTVEEKQQELLL